MPKQKELMSYKSCRKIPVKVTAREEQSLLKINMRKTSDSKVEFYVDGKIGINYGLKGGRGIQT